MATKRSFIYKTPNNTEPKSISCKEIKIGPSFFYVCVIIKMLVGFQTYTWVDVWFFLFSDLVSFICLTAYKLLMGYQMPKFYSLIKAWLQSWVYLVWFGLVILFNGILTSNSYDLQSII